MLRVGDVLGDFLWHGGLLSQALLVMALLGLFLALASGVVAFALRRAAFAVGTATLLAAAVVMGLGAVATFRARGEADARAAAVDLEPVRERIRREGYEVARAGSIAALLLGIFPMIAGAAAVLASGAQSTRPPRRGFRMGMGMGTGKGKGMELGMGTGKGQGSPAEVEPAPVPAKGGRLGTGGLPALGSFILAVVAARAEIPGRDLDKPAWDLLEHEAQIQAGRLPEGCSGLERDLASLGRAEAEPIASDLVGLADACLRHRIEASTDQAGAAAELLRASPLVIDEAQRERLRRAAGAGAAKP